jgi:uncharacterized protein (TIGR01777 family)
MNIGITGASGFLGTTMIAEGNDRGHTIIGFSRSRDKSIPGCVEVRNFGPAMDVEGIDAVFHLAGDSIMGLWTPQKRKRILESRILGTSWVVEAVRRANRKPNTLVSASGAAIYGDRGEEELTERSKIAANGFLPEVAAAWEREGATIEVARFVAVRIALVLGKEGGALPLLGPIFRFGLGGKLGNGKQWMPWVHAADVVGLFFHALEHSEIQGPLNAAAPHPVRNEEFTRVLSRTVKRPAFFQVPEFLIRALLREQSALLLDSQKILPQTAIETNYSFRFPDLTGALVNIFS